ncbi:MAG: ParA family protein, partial [Armatimonadetes bacterium]|nr:ParA family protein [Armatimonadota bacterium]
NARSELGGKDVLVVRDMVGRVRIAIRLPRAQIPDGVLSAVQERSETWGAYQPLSGDPILCLDDFVDPDAVFRSADIVELAVGTSGETVKLLDRTVVGEDWLGPSDPSVEGRPVRVAFHGVKGGVGRSTAMALTAYDLAKLGKRVLALDLDLESPGLSGMLLPGATASDFGVVDWLVEDAVGQGDAVFDSLTSVSPIAQETTGEIRVAPAAGADDPAYVAKLSRIYGDVAQAGVRARFSERVSRLVQALEARHTPDVVLIDSRAGIHDLAAVSIVKLADSALLFACETDATWRGYRALFRHWQAFPNVARAVRGRLAMVDALFPEVDQPGRAERFLENSYYLFLNTLYDESPAGGVNEEAFSFDLRDTSAPHYPFRIKWNARFREFSGSLLVSGLLGEADIQAAFGDFLDGVRRLVGMGS